MIFSPRTHANTRTKTFRSALATVVAAASGLVFAGVVVAPAASAAVYTVTDTIAVKSMPRAVGVDSGLGKVFVANFGDNSVSVIDGATNAVTSTITLGFSPNAVAVDSVSHKVYVANGESVSVIDGDAVTGTIILGFSSLGVGG